MPSPPLLYHHSLFMPFSTSFSLSLAPPIPPCSSSRLSYSASTPVSFLFSSTSLLRSSLRLCLARHTGPHQIMATCNGIIAICTSPANVYAHPRPIASNIGNTTAVAPAPKRHLAKFMAAVAVPGLLGCKSTIKMDKGLKDAMDR